MTQLIKSSYMGYGHMACLSLSFSHPQMAKAETGGEASRAAGGSRTLTQVGAGGATGTTHEGPDVYRQ